MAELHRLLPHPRPGLGPEGADLGLEESEEASISP